ERYQHAWLNDLDLFQEIRPAGLHLRRRRCSIAESSRWRIRPAFQDVCDVNVFAREIHRLQNSRQQLPGAPDEWFSLLVFFHTGRFTDEHQIGIRISDAEHCLRAGAGEMRTFRASANAFTNWLE